MLQPSVISGLPYSIDSLEAVTRSAKILCPFVRGKGWKRMHTVGGRAVFYTTDLGPFNLDFFPVGRFFRVRSLSVPRLMLGNNALVFDLNRVEGFAARVDEILSQLVPQVKFDSFVFWTAARVDYYIDYHAHNWSDAQVYIDAIKKIEVSYCRNQSYPCGHEAWNRSSAIRIYLKGREMARRLTRKPEHLNNDTKELLAQATSTIRFECQLRVNALSNRVGLFKRVVDVFQPDLARVTLLYYLSRHEMLLPFMTRDELTTKIEQMKTPSSCLGQRTRIRPTMICRLLEWVHYLNGVGKEATKRVVGRSRHYAYAARVRENRINPYCLEGNVCQRVDFVQPLLTHGAQTIPPFLLFAYARNPLRSISDILGDGGLNFPTTTKRPSSSHSGISSSGARVHRTHEKFLVWLVSMYLLVIRDALVDAIRPRRLRNEEMAGRISAPAIIARVRSGP